MTSHAKRTAALVAIAVVFCLPKQVPCEYPQPQCDTVFVDGLGCTPTDLEPYGIFLVESLIGADVAVAYRSWLDCP